MDDPDETDAASAGSATAGGPTPLPGAEQLQRAALDAVQAARAVLDVAESMIREPAAVEAMVQTVTAMARTATESVAAFAAGMSDPARPASSDPGDDDPTDDGSYQRIDLG